MTYRGRFCQIYRISAILRCHLIITYFRRTEIWPHSNTGVFVFIAAFFKGYATELVASDFGLISVYYFTSNYTILTKKKTL